MTTAIRRPLDGHLTSRQGYPRLEILNFHEDYKSELREAWDLKAALFQYTLAVLGNGSIQSIVWARDRLIKERQKLNAAGAAHHMPPLTAVWRYRDVKSRADCEERTCVISLPDPEFLDVDPAKTRWEEFPSQEEHALALRIYGRQLLAERRAEQLDRAHDEARMEECSRAVLRGDRGFVYAIQAEEGGPIKIGWAKDPTRRRRELQTANPYPLRIIGTVAGTVGHERDLHAECHRYRMSGEWFRPRKRVIDALRKAGMAIERWAA